MGASVKMRTRAETLARPTMLAAVISEGLEAGAGEAGGEAGGEVDEGAEKSLSGSTIRGSVEIRVSTVFSVLTCGGVWLQKPHGSY